jgi:hypothetical protein
MVEFGGLYLIVDYVGDRLAQHEPIDGDDGGFGCGQGEALAALLRKDAQRRDDLARQLSEVEAFAHQADGAGIAVGQAQQRVHESGQAIDLLEHAADNVPVFGGSAHVAHGALADAPDHRQGRA